MRKFLLSGDPGVANFGLVLWDLESGKCLLATKLQHAISDLTAEFQPQLDSFLAEVAPFKCFNVCLERSENCGDVSDFRSTTLDH